MIDFVALDPPVATVEARAETGERSTQAVPARHQRRRAVLWLRLDLPHRAPVLAVAPAMNVPLGVLRSLAFDGSRLHGALRAGRERSVAAPRSSDARPVRRRVGTRMAPPIELAHHPQQLPQQPAQRTPAADGAREEVCSGAVVVLVLCKLRQHSVALFAWNVLTRRRRAVGAVDRLQQISCADGPEAVRRLGDRRPAQRGSQGRGGRIDAGCDIGFDERPHRRWQQVLDRGQRAVAFDGEVSPGQRRAPRQPAHDVGIQASGCEERRLHGDRLDLLTRTDAGVDEDHPPVSPRRLAGLARRDLQGAARDRRGQQAEPPQAVAVSLVTPQESPHLRFRTKYLFLTSQRGSAVKRIPTR